MTQSKILFWVFVFLALAWLLVLAASFNKAHATDWDWSLSGDSYHQPRRKARRTYRRHVDRDDIRLYRDIDDDRIIWGRDDDKRPVCVPAFVEVKSTEHTTPENAMDAAKKMWAASAQWDWGSKYMSLNLAKDYREFCGQSNAMDTASGRINEAVSQLAGKDGVNVRCVIRARPCRAILERAEGHQ